MHLSTHKPYLCRSLLVLTTIQNTYYCKVSIGRIRCLYGYEEKSPETRFPKVGNMRVVLISANREQINMPTWPLGLACVGATTLKAGHDIKFLDLMHVPEPEEAIREVVNSFDPKVIGISARNVDDQNMIDPIFLLDQAKEVVTTCKAVSTAPIVLGGAGYSIFPQSALEYLGADMGIQGEGEQAFPELLDRIDQGGDVSDVPGLYLPGQGCKIERSFPQDLDDFVMPDPGLLFPETYPASEFWLPVQTRRGCPKNCSYCSTPTIEGRRLRMRSPDSIVNWMANWVEVGFTRFHFVDNTFNIPKSYAKTLCSEIINSGMRIKWRCIVYPSGIDEDLVDLMAQAGCVEIALGAESGNEGILQGLNKDFDLNDVRSANRLFKDHLIYRMGFLLLGGPGETKETAHESLVFTDSLKLDAVRLTVGIRIYPYTPLAQTSIEEGVIRLDEDLLFPKFYIMPELQHWLYNEAQSWTAKRPQWMM
jgi:radical SAM superfamily enzyme YgiQ (UPF0313 family)